MRATPEQEAWTQGYEACLSSVKQRLDSALEVLEALQAVADRAGGQGKAGAYRIAAGTVRNAFTDLGFPFHTDERIA